MKKNTSNIFSIIINTLILLIILAGCKLVEPPEKIKVNPNASEKYLVTIHFDDDLSGIHDVQAVNFYSVLNVETCSPYAGFQVGGGWISIDKRISTRMNSKNYNTYQTIYYPRYLLDEAYYSMDVCHWKGVGIEYRFIKNSVLYSFSIKDSDITQVRQVIIQCESLNKNRTDGISQTCKSHEPNEFSMIDSYFEITINSIKLK